MIIIVMFSCKILRDVILVRGTKTSELTVIFINHEFILCAMCTGYIQLHITYNKNGLKAKVGIKLDVLLTLRLYNKLLININVFVY